MCYSLFPDFNNRSFRRRIYFQLRPNFLRTELHVSDTVMFFTIIFIGKSSPVITHLNREFFSEKVSSVTFSSVHSAYFNELATASWQIRNRFKVSEGLNSTA